MADRTCDMPYSTNTPPTGVGRSAGRSRYRISHCFSNMMATDGNLSATVDSMRLEAHRGPEGRVVGRGLYKG
jgi:hypothetical protein